MEDKFGRLWRKLAETTLPQAEANAALLKSALGRWWSEEDSKRILRRVVPDMEALGAAAIIRAVKSLKSEVRREIQEELKNLVGPDYSANLVRKVRSEMVRWLDRKRFDEMGIPRLETRRSSCACAEEEEEEEEEEVCSVCLGRLFQEDEMIATLDCGHEYHSHCITQWLMKGVNACPLCRGTALRVPGYNRDASFLIALL